MPDAAPRKDAAGAGASARFDDPALLPFLPMLYVAWADGDLSAAEMVEIRRRAGGELEPLLVRWLDPERPPRAATLERMLATVRRLGGDLDRRERLSLAGLGLELAQAGDRVVSDEERRALVEIEEALGVAGSEAARQLLATRRPAAPAPVVEPAFDLPAMERYLDGDHRELREKVRALLSEPEFRRPPDLTRREYRELVLAWCRRLAAEGLGGLSFPPPWGPGDPGGFIAVFQTLAYGDLSLLVKFGVQFGLFGGSILHLGSEHHHRRYLERVASLALPGCFAMTETAHGSNVYDLETTARYDPETEEFVVHTPHDGARKDYIGNAALHGRLATVFAQLEIGDAAYGVHALLVPIRDEEGRPWPGVRIEDCGDKMGLNGVDNGRLWFDHVRVPRRNLLDRFARVEADGTYESPIASPSKRFFTMLGTLVGGRVSVALASNSAAETALTIAVRYGAQRRQFGPPGESETVILDYPTHQWRLMPPLAISYALHFALADLRRRYAAAGDVDRRELEALAAGFKAYASRHATDTIQTCRECCGGQGYLAVNRFADLKADTDVFTTFEGDNVVLLQLVAKSLLTGYKRQFEEMRFLGLVRFLAGRAATALSQRNPIVARKGGEAHLRSREFQLGALAARDEHTLATVARRLKKRIDRGMEPSDALLECQVHLVAAARAHVERKVIEGFAAAVDGAPAELRSVLGPLFELAALWCLERDSGWFLEHGYFEASKARAVHELVLDLCAEARRQAVPLVDAFGIPRPVLAAPIAF